MKRLAVALMVVLLALNLGASAQTQLELNEQSYAAFKKADDGLNKVYKGLLGTLDEEGQKKLKAAQRAWIKFRDEECESEADDFRGGSIRPLIYNNCAAALTEARTADMKVRLKAISGHL